jgi:hypothetical protein
MWIFKHSQCRRLTLRYFGRSLIQEGEQMPTLQKPIGSGFGATSTAAQVIKGINLSGKDAIVTGELWVLSERLISGGQQS